MKKKIILAMFMMILIGTVPKVKAAVIEDNRVVAANKIWTIHFNQGVVFDDLSKQDIVVTDSNGAKVNVTLKQADDKSVVVDPPDGGYKEGEAYKLIIGDKVHSKYSKNIKNKIMMNFSIEKNGEAITFKDANLEKVVRDVAKKPEGALYENDVLKITQLDADNKGIQYLDGIENLKNLESLNIADNSIQDISAISSLENLKSLNISGNFFDNVDCLKQMDNLNSIDGNKDLNVYFKTYDKASEIIKYVIKSSMSQRNKEAAIFRYILHNTIQDDSKDDSSYEVLVNGRGGSYGYSNAMKLLLNMAGIRCIVVEGTVCDGTQKQYWNMVELDGKYYHVETSWYDPSDYYAYLNAKDSLMRLSHQWDYSKYPKCE